MTLLIFLIVGVLVGAGTIYFVLRPKLKITQILDEETLNRNQNLRDNLVKLSNEYNILEAERNEIVKSISLLQSQANEAADAYYQKSYELANEKINQAAESMANNYRQLQQQAKSEYLQTLEDCTQKFQEQIKEKEDELQKVNIQLQDLTAKVTAAVEAAKRTEELRTKQDFYRLQLSEADIEEIKHLRSVTPYLRDSEPLNKVIWKVYYEKPYTDLIGRVIGPGVHTGIYKITNIENQMCYVGQAASLTDRWKQHIKRGIGAEAPTRNKLYPAMLEFGVENFTFEVVEECDRSKLNEREDYWQEYFHAKEFGYSIK